MKKKKKLIFWIIFIIILFVISIVSIPKFLKEEGKNLSSETFNVKEKEDIGDDDYKNENTSEEIVKEKEVENDNKLNNKEVKTEDEKEKNEVIKESVKPKETKKKENSINNNSNTEVKEEEKVQNNNEVKEEEKVQNNTKDETNEIQKAWDELGITEDEYYNKPMWSWARIDYSINEYKTYEKTREACMKKGEELFQEGYGYSCTSINSYSGKYLGEMLKTF